MTDPIPNPYRLDEHPEELAEQLQAVEDRLRATYEPGSPRPKRPMPDRFALLDRVSRHLQGLERWHDAHEHVTSRATGRRGGDAFLEDWDVAIEEDRTRSQP